MLSFFLLNLMMGTTPIEVTVEDMSLERMIFNLNSSNDSCVGPMIEFHTHLISLIK